MEGAKIAKGQMRNVVFTWNNYPEDHVDMLSKMPDNSYLVYGYEVAKTGTPHLQGYIEFEKPVRFETLKKRFPKVYFAKRKGTATQAADYCKKEGHNVFEEGTISQQGKRTDIDCVRDQMQGDKPTLREVVLIATSVQSVRFAEIYLKYHEVQRDFKPSVTWLFGKAGTGKTLRAREDAKARGFGDDIHVQSNKEQWWEGYDAHKVVILDDIRKTFCSFVRMLNLLDRYPCRIECKGGSRQLIARHMYITAPCPPEEMWDTNEQVHQLLRRIDNIEEIISFTDSIIHKGNGIPIYKEEDIQEEVNSPTESEGWSDISYEEVRTESNAESGDETGVGASQRGAAEHIITRVPE